MVDRAAFIYHYLYQASTGHKNQQNPVLLQFDVTALEIGPLVVMFLYVVREEKLHSDVPDNVKY
jgi:hypothetical protein